MHCCSIVHGLTKGISAGEDQEDSLMDDIDRNERERFTQSLETYQWRKEFIESCVDYCISERKWTFLSILLVSGSIDVDENTLETLYESANEDENQLNNLFQAFVKNPRVSEYLCSYALFLASRDGHLNVVKSLMNLNCDPNIIFKSDADESEDAALHMAVHFGHSAVFRYLFCQPSVDPSITNGEGKTILHIATEKRQYGILKDILLHRPDLLELSGTQLVETPLQTAIKMSCVECVRVLLEYGADVNAMNVSRVGMPLSNCTPLMLATSREDAKLVDMLLKHPDCRIDAQDSISRMTALHRAADIGNEDIVTLLLDHGAHPNPVDAHQATPLSLAVNERHLGTALILLPYIGDPDPQGNILLMAYHRNIMGSILVPFVSMGAGVHKDLRGELSHIVVNVFSLKCLCKITIRKAVGVMRKCVVPKLGLPKDLGDYLFQYQL